MIYDKLLENIIEELELQGIFVNKEIVLNYAIKNVDIKKLQEDIIVSKYFISQKTK